VKPFFQKLRSCGTKPPNWKPRRMALLRCASPILDLRSIGFCGGQVRGESHSGKKSRWTARSVRVQVPPPAPTFHAPHAGKQRARWSSTGALGLEPSLRNVSPAGNACYPELFLLTIRLMLDAAGLMAPDNRDARREEYRRTI
jgi:hypothetical protein